MGVEVVYNHADYRLISSRVLKEFANFKEVNLFLRGMIPLVGFKSSSVYYERHERIAGESHYPLSCDRVSCQLCDHSPDYTYKTENGHPYSQSRDQANWLNTVCIVCFMGDVQLICLGVLGEYIGKIYMEVKARPRYIISERTWEEKDQNR